MFKLLLPIDGSDRSRQSIDWVKTRYAPKDVSITLLLVREDWEKLVSPEQYAETKEESMPMLRESANELKGFEVDCQVRFGRAGEEILHFAEDHQIDTIVMTKSTKIGWTRMIGSVTTHVVKYASCIVVIVPEARTALDSQ